MQSQSTVDITYHLPYTFPAPRYTSNYDPLSLEDYDRLGHGPSYQLNIDGAECIVYTDSLNWFLKCERVEVTNVGNLEIEIIDGTTYIDSYKTGFLDGINHFNDRYRFDKYAPILGFDNYVKTLREKCSAGCYGPLMSQGWKGVRRSRIGRLSQKIIREHGFYAGLYSQVEKLMNDYEPIRNALFFKNDVTDEFAETSSNNFNEMSLKEVRDHFHVLTKKKSISNSQPYLTENQFELFINKAFLGNSTIDMITANLGKGEKEIMGALFLMYYEKCENLGIALQGVQKKYVGLLTENFTNYKHLSKTLSTNFKKYETRKKSWTITI